MRFIAMLVIGLAVAGVMLYFFLGQQKMLLVKTQQSQGSAQSAADAYRKNQENMMKQLQR